MQLYTHLKLFPEDPILGLAPLFKADPRTFKVNLGIGAYLDEKGLPVVLDAVHQAEEWLVEQNLNKEYLPIEGNIAFSQLALKLVLGEDCSVFQDKRVVTIQTIGASGALRLSAELLKECGLTTVYVSDPSWSNHRALFSKVGLTVGVYPYYDWKKHRIPFEDLLAAVEQIPVHSGIVLQACCHNPTGCDLTQEQWSSLSSLLKSKQIIPIFDIAYQGLGEGWEQDCWPIRYFMREHIPLINVSFSKNFGLYGERIGLLGVVLPDPSQYEPVLSNLKRLIRSNYSTPPLHGARIIQTILEQPSLKQLWETQLKQIRDRLKKMRQLFIEELTKDLDKDFTFMMQGKGLFSLTGLSKEQVHWIREAKGVYMLDNGRINLAGLNESNLNYVIESFLQAFSK